MMSNVRKIFVSLSIVRLLQPKRSRDQPLEDAFGTFP
jgi:hypothetical protein